MLRGLDLFSGIGGLTLALSEWVRPVAYCEIERYAQAVLLSRMASGELPTAPIWDDVQTLTGDMLPEIDIIYGGFPCQDISCAGRRAGLEGEQSGLFFELLRLVRQIEPAFVFVENVSSIQANGGCDVVEALTKSGYDCRWDFLSAAEVGSIYLLRERFWLLAANNNQSGTWREWQRSRQVRAEPAPACANGASAGPPKGFLQPRVERSGDGLPFRMERNRCLGNSVVPQCAREAFMRLSGLHRENWNTGNLKVNSEG